MSRAKLEAAARDLSVPVAGSDREIAIAVLVACGIDVGQPVSLRDCTLIKNASDEHLICRALIVVEETDVLSPAERAVMASTLDSRDALLWLRDQGLWVSSDTWRYARRDGRLVPTWIRNSARFSMASLEAYAREETRAQDLLWARR